MNLENIDKYGHCVYCHRNLIFERVVDGKVIFMFSPDKEETEFLLDDGSRMRVCICRQCKTNIDLHDKKVHEDIMESVINGWELEIKGLVKDENKPEWTYERGKKHMDFYRIKKILFRSDDIEKNVIDRECEKIIKNIEKKEIEEIKK